MARGGARPGAGRPAGKSANTSPLSRGRAPAREAAGNQRPWPADKVERWAIDRLIPYAKNARTHTDAQVAAIAASIKEWGWTSPALVGEDGGLICGPRQGVGCPAARHCRGPCDGRRGLERGAKERLGGFQLGTQRLGYPRHAAPSGLRRPLPTLSAKYSNRRSNRVSRRLPCAR